MKIALALSGGGTKGAYQVGVFRAILENNIPYHIVVGTSIGAINGALIVQRDFQLMEKLWHDIELHQIMNINVNLDFDEIMKMDKRELLVLLKQYVRNRGFDNQPFKDLVKRYTNIEKMRNSDVEFAVKIASFPKIVGFDINMKTIDENKINSYLIASASCFPAFPIMTIDNSQYIDGGYVDRLPIDLAFHYGADHVIAVDLSNGGPIHPKYVNHPRVTYIKSVHNLGPFLFIKKEIIERNIMLGYLDATKALGLKLGYQYTFDRDMINEEDIKQVHQAFITYQSKLLSKILNIGHIKDDLPLKSYLRMLEVLADALQINPYRTYGLNELKTIIDQNIEIYEIDFDLLIETKKYKEIVASLKKMDTIYQIGWVKSKVMKGIVFDETLLTMLAKDCPIAFICLIFYLNPRK
jgi:NTE family protein